MRQSSAFIRLEMPFKFEYLRCTSVFVRLPEHKNLPRHTSASTARPKRIVIGSALSAVCLEDYLNCQQTASPLEALELFLDSVGQATTQTWRRLFPATAPTPYLASPSSSYIPPPPGFLLGRDMGVDELVHANNSELDRHMLLLGSTGSGKTTLILRLFDEEVQKWL